MFGRRPDGIRISNIDPVIRITPYIMPMRCDAEVLMKHSADMEIISRYIRKQKLEKNESISHMQIVAAAYVRSICNTPEVNRFIMNKELYARNNCSIAFTILKDPQDIEKGEAVVKVKFDPTDTIYDIRDRMNAAVEANRGDKPDGLANRMLGWIFIVPGLATVLTGLVRLLDRYGLAPGILMEELPFYVSMYLTNTASLGLHYVNHHIYNWGNVGQFISIGHTEKTAVSEDGKMRIKPFLPLGFTIDERVCSGAHYGKFFNDFKRYLSHPELLETPPETVRFDNGCEYHEPKIKKEQL